MRVTRRHFGKLALAAVPAAVLLERTLGTSVASSRPNSLINGVQVGTITYSYRSLADQSAEAILRYVVASGISAIELMNEPAERFAGAPAADAGAAALRTWRLNASMDRFKALRRMYNQAGVTIYAWKCLSPEMSDDEVEYVFTAAAALGCTHTTLELIQDVPALTRIGQFAETHKIYAAYHSHTQGSMTAFDRAFAASRANMANVDFGHYVAGGNRGGSALQFLDTFHDRIASFHMKDRTTPEAGEKNLIWGAGQTPLAQILQMVKKNHWTMPATIELEYEVPIGSDAVEEVQRCLRFCQRALA